MGTLLFTLLLTTLVPEGLMTTDGQLHASQMAVTVFSNSTQQWHVALTCGTFTCPADTPPFSVEWTTPSGQSVSSSKYKEGQFLLLLDNPVSGGSYTCHVPQSSASVACLHGNSINVSSAVVVDDVKSRLTLLEAENQQLKGSVIELKAENGQLKDHLVKQENHTNARIDSVSTVLSQHLHDEKTKRVSFHAKGLIENTPSVGEVLIPKTVRNNQGNGYNPSTGKFTAPYSGTYCFLSSLCGGGSGQYIGVYLMVDGRVELMVISDIDSAGLDDAASLQAVVSVRAGQSVWLEAAGGGNHFGTNEHANSFSGFLVSYDL